MRILSLGVAMAVSLLQPALPSIQEPVPAEKGSIEGVVTRMGSVQPIAGAEVSLVRYAGEPPRSVRPIVATSDDEGKFLFRALGPGTYFAVAKANGYVDRTCYFTGCEQQGIRIVLAEGGNARNIVVGLTPTGYVNGVIRDDAGAPVAGLPVELLRIRYNGLGQRYVVNGGSTFTNDRGQYRLFYITPGRYALAAATDLRIDSLMGFVLNIPNGVRATHTLTYYPGVVDPRNAVAIDVEPGVDLAGMDFVVPRQQPRAIRGRVVDATNGGHPLGAGISLLAKTSTLGSIDMVAESTVRAEYNPADGTFEIRDVPPGAYVLRVRGLGPQKGRPAPSASFALTVSNADVEAIAVSLFAPVTIPGRLTIEGMDLANLPDWERIRIRLVPSHRDLIEASPPQAELNDDGTFAVADVLPGEYWIAVCMPPAASEACLRGAPGFYLKDARFDNADALARPLQFGGTVATPLGIALSSKPGEIEGRVVDGKQDPAPGVSVAMIPEDRSRIDLYKTAETDRNGHFTIRGITPGTYKAFAWENLEEHGYFDPDLILRHEAGGTLVQVAESRKVTVDVTIIPASAP